MLLTMIGAAAADPSKAQESLRFHASFDREVDAETGGGDRRLHWAPKMTFPADGSVGLPASKSVTWESQGGVRGGYLRFHKKVEEMVFFHAKGNVPYSKDGWNGTVSFWLKLNPDEDLEPGYCDPIQITSKSWDNAAFFVEFSKDEKPREFRLGSYADFAVWNPQKRDWNAIPFSEKPLVQVIRPPFSREAWTHVAFTFENFNTGKSNGVAKLFLNGESRGALSPRTQTFTWDLDKAMIMLGLSYVGDFDDLAIFSEPLAADEIQAIFRSRGLAAAK